MYRAAAELCFFCANRTTGRSIDARSSKRTQDKGTSTRSQVSRVEQQSSVIRRSFVYPHRCTLPSQHAQHFEHLCKCVVLRQIAPC